MSNHFQFGVSGSSYIFVAVALKAMGISLRESARRGLPHENYLGLVQCCGGDATFCQITAYTYGSAALLPKHVSQQHRASKQWWCEWKLTVSYGWHLRTTLAIVRNAATRVAVGYKFATIGRLVTISHHILLVLSSMQFGNSHLYSLS